MSENKISHLENKYSRATYELIKACDKDELQLYLWFKLWAINKNTLFPSMKTAADDLEVSKRTIMRTVEKMENKNRLKVKNREGKTNIYDITWYDLLVAKTSQGSDKSVTGGGDKNVTLTNINKTKRKKRKKKNFKKSDKSTDAWIRKHCQ